MERETGNPRRPAWEAPRRLHIKDRASTAANTDPWGFSNLRPLLPQQPLNGVETECMSAESTGPHVGPMSGSRTGWRSKLSTGESVVKG